MARSDLMDLIQEYEVALQRIKDAKRETQKRLQEHPELERDVWLYESMARSLDYTLCLMEGTTRVEHREVLIGDPAVLDRLAAKSIGTQSGRWDRDDEGDEGDAAGGVVEWWRQRLPVAWRSVLSLREAACLFAYERGMSYAGIAQALGVTRGSVQSYVRRAREKLERANAVQLGLFDDTPDLGA
ncbi:sigma factor-like helix-turn-helix DNA-binding protein [Alicyclobacillus sendaiensis]|uniref:sigma factor-like helix-turn-helix DNA-binding protein n=1 Tax=Alicyclobacillus sendaiensis TaxID=192387 RepID=UPI0009F8BAB0|nr:sigma factor-like helix-turn-helix DNA-binding protein [Alicyclobacillus sendaiensis]